MGNSFYIQLSSYLLLEYIYGDTDTKYLSNQAKLARIKNDYHDGQLQFLNTSPSQNITQNVMNMSAARLDSSKWAYLNTDVPTPYINIDSKLTYTDMSSLLTSLDVVYDKVRVHIVSGYRLDDIQGLILQIYAREAQTSLTTILANNVYLNSDDRDILNPRPIMLGDKMYDRYIEVLVPSVKEVNSHFYSNPVNQLSIGYQYSSNNRGWLYETQIYVKVYEIGTLERKNGNIFLNTTNDYEVNVNQEDKYSGLAASIQEATDGDYFLYYPTYNGNFIEDFISSLNAAGGNNVVINDIDQYEQVGSEQILTFSFSQLQVSSFDKPLEFRPIVKFADSAVAFSLDYTVRIFNRENGFQLIRRSSTTSFSPKKYGKELERISLANQSYPMKVYNKVVDGPSVTFSQPAANTNFTTVYVPVFYDTKQIVTQTKSIVSPTGDTDTGGNIFFGQGDARIYLSNFDSYVKFVVNKVDKKTLALTNMDLTYGTITIVFRDAQDNPISFPLDTSTTLNSRAKGELVFHLPGTLKKKVLYDKKSKYFDIVVESEGTPATVIYSGSVETSDKISEESTRVDKISSSSTTQMLNTSSQVVGKPVSTATSTAVVGKPVSMSVETTNSNASLLTTLTVTNSQALSSGDKLQVKPPVIPSYSNDANAVSVKVGIKPKTKASDKTVEEKLSQTKGTSISTSNDTKRKK